MPIQYEELQYDDSFRVLSLLPSHDTSSELHFTLEAARLSSDVQYEAVSYTWADSNGCSDPCAPVFCSDIRMDVTANCDAVLRCLRKKDNVRTLWVDAICINQQSYKERGHQVELMRQIYEQASSVSIYLGPASPVSGVFFDYLPRMADELRLQMQTEVGDQGSRYQDLTHAIATYVQSGTLTPLVQGFLDVTRRPWWSRIWVVQEAVSAKAAVVICGDRMSAYADFVALYSGLAEDTTHDGGLTWFTLEGFKHHLMSTSMILRLGDGYDIRNVSRIVLPRSRRLKATDPRDHINGLYGLLSGISNVFSFPPPDYSVHVCDLFRDVTIRLSATLGLGFLLCEVARIEEDSNLPSWCVDWSKGPQHHTPSPNEYYRAALGTRAIYTFSSDGKELRVKGIFVDAIRDLPKVDASAYTYPYIPSKSIYGYKQSCLVGMSMERHLSFVGAKEALWRTLCWNVDVNYSYPAPTEIGDHFQDFYRVITSDRPIQDIEQDLLTQAPVYNDIAVHSMPLCVTENCLLGSVPQTAEVGDRIAIVTGNQTPLVLRQQSDGSHRLVGACYVHGLMDGEGFPMENDLLSDIIVR